MFTVLAAIDYEINDKSEFIVLPMIYALLETKEEAAYSKVFEVILSAAESFEIPYQTPLYVICDFESAIINSIIRIIGEVVRACFFIYANRYLDKFNKLKACCKSTTIKTIVV